MSVVTLVGTPDPEPCVHYWHAVDERDDVYRCSRCHLTWSLDDDPDDDGPVAA